MRVYIVKEAIEYSMVKVSDGLIDKFCSEYQEMIVVEGKDIQDVIGKFSEMDKEPEFELNARIIKYKADDQLTI